VLRELFELHAMRFAYPVRIGLLRSQNEWRGLLECIGLRIRPLRRRLLLRWGMHGAVSGLRSPGDPRHLLCGGDGPAAWHARRMRWLRAVQWRVHLGLANGVHLSHKQRLLPSSELLRLDPDRGRRVQRLGHMSLGCDECLSR